MIYPKIGAKRRGKMTVTSFSGGINRRDMPSELKDDQLSDAENLWLKDGVLRTRPALRAASDAVEGAIAFVQNPNERYVVRQQDAQFYTGEVLEDGTQVWNSAAQTGAAGMRVPFDVTRLDGWEDGAGDGTILFLQDGTPIAPLAEGGYRSLKEFVYVPQLLAGGVGAASMFDPPPTVTLAEERNLLTSAFRASFTTDGEGQFFYLPVEALDPAEPITAIHRTAEGRTFTHTIAAGETAEEGAAEDGLCMAVSMFHRCVFFTDAEGITVPKGAGVSDNLEIRACSYGVDTSLIGKMAFGCWFGGTNSGLIGGTRLFVAGNPTCPHKVYWSDIEKPLYFPENNFAGVGDTTGAITAFGKQGKLLVIFKEREMYAMSYLAPSSGSGMSTMGLSLFPLHGEIGCDCPATIRLCHNRLLWMSGNGRVYTLIGDNAYNQCNVRHVSGLVEPYLKSKGRAALAAASAACMEGWYLLLVGAELLLLRYADTVFERITSYATGDEMAQNGMVWYRWTLPQSLQPKRLLNVSDTAVLIDATGRSHLFGGKKDMVLQNGEMFESDITARLSTKLYDFGYADTRKRVREITLAAGSTKGCRLSAEYVSDKGTKSECRDITLLGAETEIGSFLRMCRLTPHAAHLRFFGLKLTAVGDAVFGPLTVRYDIDNAVQRGE